MIPLASPFIGEEEKQAVADVLESGMLAQGPRVAEFEEKFAAYVGARHAIATSNGTTALQMALLAHGVGPGDEVITTPFSFIASTTAIMMTGAKPVFVDIDPARFTICPRQTEAAVTARTKAVLAVDIFGQPAPAYELIDIAQRHGLAYIADAAQAHGAAIDDARIGSLTTTCFSFYPTKNMTTGEGGIVTTNDDTIADEIRLLRNHGMKARYQYERLGYNFRMMDLQAAIGLCQLDKLEAFNAARAENAARLTERIGHIVQCPVAAPGTRHVFHQYTVLIPSNRDAVRDALRESGVGCEVFYPHPLYAVEPIIAHGFGGDVPCPETEKACKQVLSLPCHPKLTPDDIGKIADALKTAVEKNVAA
ncbi:MAG: DegT/DnrJ/EryC1/StrS family aminotransferase [Rhodospirillales bacterium]